MNGWRSPERRARRLVRWYPRAWRMRYGPEFTQMLIDELTEAPLSLTRQGDVIAHGLSTRLTYLGLAGSILDRPRRMRAMLGALGAVAVGFLMLAVGVWSQLSVGRAWSAPADPGTRVAIWLMSAALLGFVASAAVAVVPLGVLVLRRLAHHGAMGLWRPLLTLSLAGLAVYLGCVHFAAHWPGSGGHAGGLGVIGTLPARLGWAATLWISAYWAHPAALRSFPAGELAWMLISPVAWLILFTSGAALLRGLQLNARLQHGAVVLATGAVGLMIAFLVGAVIWVTSAATGPRHLFAAGTIDLAIIARLGGGLVVATKLVRGMIATSASALAG